MQINIPTDRITQTGNKIASRVKNVKVSHPKRLKYILAALLIVIIALIVILKWPEPTKPVYPKVEAQPVIVDDVEIYGEYAGKIKAKQHVEVRARVEGYLEQMHFEEGRYIKKNDILFTIDPKLYKARVEKAKAQLNKNKALEQKAERDLARIKPLYEQNAASLLDLDNATAAHESAKAEVVMSEADLTQAEIALSYTTVRSPISGYISESSADIGTLVGPGGKSLLATIVNSDTVQVNFSMTGLDYLKSKERNVNLGQKIEERNWNPYITITLADHSEYPFIGMVDFADPQVDPNTGTFSVRAEMPNPDHILLPGQLTKVKLLLDVRENAIVVPTKALVIEKGGAFVFVVRKDNIVEKRFIELGPEILNNVVVERGLGADEMIIVEGFHKLTHGMQVEVVNSIETKDEE
jgi:membrane fusion protein (multidrug efflux system)